jgi:polysaccharide export outer membrane protein
MWPTASFSRLTIALLVALSVQACARQQAEVAPPVELVPPPPPGVGGPYVPAAHFDVPYLLDAGDRLRIQVFGQDGLTNSYIVDAAGNISMPLIGTVRARGHTTVQLGNVIAARLRNGFIRQPHVSVEVEVYRPFFILGEVNAPGQYPFVPNMTVEAAVAIAGGFAPRANRRDIILARNHNGEITRGPVPPDFPMQPGDTITVRERWF